MDDLQPAEAKYNTNAMNVMQDAGCYQVDKRMDSASKVSSI